MSKNKLKKLDLANNLSKKKGFSTLHSKKIMNDLISILSLSLKKKKLHIKNIGSFKIIDKHERMGRDPKTKQTHTISPRKSISFIPSKKLIKLLNK